MNPRDLGKYFYIQISDTSKVGPKYYVRKEVALDPQLETLTGTSLPETMSLDEAKQLFNHFSDFTVKDPLGYYNTEYSAYFFIRDTFEDKYEHTLEDIEDGRQMGTTYAIEAKLGIDKNGDQNRDALYKNIRDLIKESLPKGMAYSDLKAIELDERGEKLIENLIDSRVTLTQSFSVKRSLGRNKITREDVLNNIRNRVTSASTELNAYWEDVLDDKLTNLVVDIEPKPKKPFYGKSNVVTTNDLSLSDLDELLGGGPSL